MCLQAARATDDKGSALATTHAGMPQPVSSTLIATQQQPRACSAWARGTDAAERSGELTSATTDKVSGDNKGKGDSGAATPSLFAPAASSSGRSPISSSLSTELLPATLLPLSRGTSRRALGFALVSDSDCDGSKGGDTGGSAEARDPADGSLPTSHVSSTRPPDAVNLIALETRLDRICRHAQQTHVEHEPARPRRAHLRPPALVSPNRRQVVKPMGCQLRARDNEPR